MRTVYDENDFPVCWGQLKGLDNLTSTAAKNSE